jgi:hypothetical protein
MGHELIAEFCRAHELRTEFFRRCQRVFRDEVQPQLDERERLLVENAAADRRTRPQDEAGGAGEAAARGREGARVTPLSWAFLIDSVPFTKAVIAGETSLGGSESACLGLARALKRAAMTCTSSRRNWHGRRHRAGRDRPAWHPRTTSTMSAFIEWDVVCALRMWPRSPGGPSTRGCACCGIRTCWCRGRCRTRHGHGVGASIISATSRSITGSSGKTSSPN